MNKPKSDPKTPIDVLTYNRSAWDRLVTDGNKWTQQVNAEQVSAARRGDWEVVLTPTKPVPREWFGDLTNCNLLGLASAGGQQMPLLAAAGATVTSFDNSDLQLSQDRAVAERDGLSIRTVQGDMADLSEFPDASFDLIFHPVSNCFVPDVLPVWREAFRVLRPGGALLAGFANPILYLWDDWADREGRLELRHSIPFSSLIDLSEQERQRYIDADEPLEFGHTLRDQLGGQLDAGFLIAGMYEDSTPDTALDAFIPTFVATRAIKPT